MNQTKYFIFRMIIRIQSPDGMSRVNLESSALYTDLYSKTKEVIQFLYKKYALGCTLLPCSHNLLRGFWVLTVAFKKHGFLASLFSRRGSSQFKRHFLAIILKFFSKF
jgi:hypothetical protein